MKKLIRFITILLYSILLFSNLCFAATGILNTQTWSGNVTIERWDEEEENGYERWQCVVPEDSTLTIEPGTIITVDDGCQLLIEGIWMLENPMTHP
jgi:hypothetical protein